MIIKNKSTFFLIIIVLLALPVVLNYVLQISIAENIIGDEVVWLNFWVTYIGVLLNALMVYAAFRTITKTTEVNMSQKRSEWLCSFRTESANLLSSVDLNYINVLAQKALWDKTTKVMEECFRLENSFRKSNFVLNALLQEYDSLFDETKGGKYIHLIDSYMTFFYTHFREFAQFSVICDYVSIGNLNEHAFRQVLAMKADMKRCGFRAIEKALADLEKLSPKADDIEASIMTIKRETYAKILKNLAEWDYKELEKVLLTICRNEAKEINSMSFFMWSKNN